MARARRCTSSAVSRANACWRDQSHLTDDYQAYIRPYVERLQKLGITPASVACTPDLSTHTQMKSPVRT